jgi:hypothetical protein
VKIMRIPPWQHPPLACASTAARGRRRRGHLRSSTARDRGHDQRPAHPAGPPPAGRTLSFMSRMSLMSRFRRGPGQPVPAAARPAQPFGDIYTKRLTRCAANGGAHLISRFSASAPGSSAQRISHSIVPRVP